MSKPINLEDKLRSKKNMSCFFFNLITRPLEFSLTVSATDTAVVSAQGIVYHASSPLDQQGDKNTCFDTNSIILRPVTGFGYLKFIILLCIECCNGFILECYQSLKKFANVFQVQKVFMK